MSILAQWKSETPLAAWRIYRDLHSRFITIVFDYEFERIISGTPLATGAGAIAKELIGDRIAATQNEITELTKRMKEESSPTVKAESVSQKAGLEKRLALCEQAKAIVDARCVDEGLRK